MLNKSSRVWAPWFGMGCKAQTTAIAQLAVVMALTRADFFKSMSSHADHRVWQDVYRPTTPAGEVYLKLTVVDDVLIVSFKEL